jgi:short subunit dehydrogenase-like uncharacterized protein
MRPVMAARVISVLGATGYTGGLIVRELKRRGAAVLAAGRQREKLRQLADDIGDLETLEADVNDPASLDRLARRSQVLINAAGPFIDYGEPVVRAAIASGAHYLDTAGEQPFMRAMLAHDEAARQRHVAVVSAQAFEVAVTDCAAAIAAEGFREVASVHVTYATVFHASQGTQRTVLRMLQSAGYAYLGGEWVEEPPAAVTRVVNFPDPVGTVTAVSFPSAEVITIPRHIAVREVRVFMGMPRLAAQLAPAVVPAARALLRSPLGRLAALVIGGGTGGPDEATRTADTFHVAVDVCGVRDGAAKHCRMFVHGRDPYGLTAVIAAQGATRMCAGDYDRSGVLPPAAAFEPHALLDSLGEWGVAYEIEGEGQGVRRKKA